MDIEILYNSVVTEHKVTIEKMLSSTSLLQQIADTSQLLLTAIRNGKKLLICGNGGSAADAQHIATEFVCRFYVDRKALNAESLSVNTSSLTAISNDYSFKNIFSRQIEAKGHSGDVLFGISTSGTSENIISAFDFAKTIGMKTVCFTGSGAPSSLDALCNIVIRVPSSCTPRIQECHILLGHIICEFIEDTLFGKTE